MTETCARCGAKVSGPEPPIEADPARGGRDQAAQVCSDCASFHAIDTVQDASAPLQETLDAVTHLGDSDSPNSPRVGSPRQEWQAGELLFDEYVVQRTLGIGGMGAVYLVESRISGQNHAVKRTRCVDPEAREALLAEMGIWRDLPEHPNLATCHFFRTLGDDVVIFAEYVDGGSLDEALRANADRWSERKRCDIALQFAFGLEAAHVAGYVHQDIKPGNVLLTSDGVAKITDFGLARTQQLLATGKGPAGLTPAYCSPEQAFRDQPITAATDIWSWAVSVLELFVGEIRWQTGIFAPGVMELYTSGRLADSASQMPGGLADILKLAFRNDVDKRWQSSTALCNALTSFWDEHFGEPYGRPRRRPAPATTSGKRRSARLPVDPRVWLDEPVADSRELDEVGRLALFERAARKLRSSVTDGQASHDELAALLVEKGEAHHAAHDWTGALDAFDQAEQIARAPHQLVDIARGRGVVHNEQRRFDLAENHLEQALALVDDHNLEPERRAEILIELAETRWSGRRAQADAAIERAHAAVADREDDFGSEMTARALILRANLLASTGQRDEACELHRSAIERYETLILLDGRTDLRPRLGAAYFNLATGLIYLNRNDESLRLFDRALRLLDDLVSLPNGRRWAPDLALAQTNASVLLRRMGDLDRSEELLRRAVGIFERSVHLEGRRDLEDKLTSAYLNLSTLLSRREEFEEALSLADRVVTMRRRLVVEEGRDDQRVRLATILGNKGVFLAALDRNEEASEAYGESIELREGLLAEGDESVAAGLARQYVNRAELHITRGIWEDALADLQRADDLVDDEAWAVRLEIAHERAITLIEMGRKDDARAVARQADGWSQELDTSSWSAQQSDDEEVRAATRSLYEWSAQGPSVEELEGVLHRIKAAESATPQVAARAILLIARSLADRPDQRLALVVEAAQDAIDGARLSERLELSYLRSLATGDTVRADVMAQIRREAARTGRVQLRRIIQ